MSESMSIVLECKNIREGVSIVACIYSNDKCVKTVPIRYLPLDMFVSPRMRAIRDDLIDAAILYFENQCQELK